MTLPAVPRISTGIHGLDDILGGGLPRSRLYLLQGQPGVGKTTLALQFLRAGVEAGETSLYITLSETEDELRGAAASHDWSLEGFTIFQLASAVTSAAVAGDHDEEAYTLFHPGEIELTEAMHTLLDEVDRVKPTRVVFDSLSEIRMLAQDALRYRRQILALKQFFAGRDCTVMLLDDMTGAASDRQVESLAHGVLTLEQNSPMYGADRRRLRISKLRGVRFRSGYHDYTIETGGIVVFPRLVAAEHHAGFVSEPMSSGVAGLDTLLNGGLDRGTSTLIMGPTGAGKSVIAAQFAVAAADRGEHAAVFSFDESLGTLLTRADALAIKLRSAFESKRVLVQQVDPAELTPGEFTQRVRNTVERDGARVIVIDSLNGYLQAMPEEQFLVLHLHELLMYLSQRGVMTILVAAQHGLLGPMTTPVDVSYVADAVLLLRYFEAEGTVRRAISVVKKRSGGHERSIREFQLVAGRGLEVGAPLSNFHGVLTGVPTYTGARAPLMGNADDRGQR